MIKNNSANEVSSSDKTHDGPLISPQVSLPEITLRVIVLGVILTIILAAANAYLGLKVGQTISASIPAAIISMSILRFFRHSNVLENTMVQTMASVGESLIAGISFILPALIILHAWTRFYYWQTVMISLLGGILGVLFTIPLRRALLFDKTLRYPEGMAISNVLRASTQEKTDIRSLTLGGIIGGLISLLQTGFQVLTDTFDFWVKSSTGVVYGFELGLSPALIAAGYIVGLNVAISFLVGSAIGWLAGVPILSYILGVPETSSASDAMMMLYRSQIRYIGVGTMLVGALWTLLTLIKPIVQSVSASFVSLREAKTQGNVNLRTERDIPMNYVMWGVILLLVPIFILIVNSIMPQNTQISHTFRTLLAGFSACYVIVGGFLFSAISSYFAGLIGSSNTPGSGLTVSALLILCLSILAFFSTMGGIHGNELLGVVLAIGTCVIISICIAISNDTMQDLKVGQVIGATPWKQQLMLIAGVVVSSFIVPPILDLLYNAYGIGGVFPRPGMNPAQMLSAPQAALMATVAEGTYTHHLQWSMIIIGAVIAFFCIIIDEILKQFGTRLPVLAVGLAIYLPMNTTIPVVIGGLLAYFIERGIERKYDSTMENIDKIIAHRHRGLLIACGMVAGASLMGVILAFPFAIKQSSDALRIMPEAFMPFAGVLSIIVTVLMCLWMYREVLKRDK